MERAIQTQQQLSAMYEAHLSRAHARRQIASKLSCPLLLSVVAGWESAEERLLVVGQETFGWDLTEQDGSGQVEAIKSFRQLLDAGPIRERIDALTHKYEVFFSGAGWGSRPFWSEMERLRGVFGRGAVQWSNIFRFDFDDGSVLRATRDERDEIFAIQDGLLRSEIEILEPTAVVFFTGPNYDFALKQEFGGILTTRVAGFPPRGFARLESGALPPRSFRMYHPRYLWQSKKRDWLKVLERELLGDA